MSLNVIDTDILSLFREGNSIVCQNVVARPRQELAIAVITVEEVLSGWYTLLRRSTQPRKLANAYQQLAESVAFLASWQILVFPELAMAWYEGLKAMKLKVRKNDLRIAAIALEYNAILVTRNVRDFQRVPGLTVENWAV